jgi:hypothetical protein
MKTINVFHRLAAAAGAVAMTLTMVAAMANIANNYAEAAVIAGWVTTEGPCESPCGTPVSPATALATRCRAITGHAG